MRAGLSFRVALKACLEEAGSGFKGLAEAEGLNRSALSALVGGTARSPYNRERDALAGALGVTRKWLDKQLAL